VLSPTELRPALGESFAFPEGTDLVETLEFYFQCCSVELDTQSLAVVAATFANAGINPLTNDVFKPSTVRHCLLIPAGRRTSRDHRDYAAAMRRARATWTNCGRPLRRGVNPTRPIMTAGPRCTLPPPRDTSPQPDSCSAPGPARRHRPLGRYAADGRPAGQAHRSGRRAMVPRLR